jgi:hypothetical protein
MSHFDRFDVAIKNCLIWKGPIRKGYWTIGNCDYLCLVIDLISSFVLWYIDNRITLPKPHSEFCIKGWDDVQLDCQPISNMALCPSHGVAGAIRADILTVLKSRSSPEELATLIGPSLAAINQWANQLPLLLSNALALDLLFALRKDIFNGPAFVISSFGTPLVDLPEPFRAFSTLIRDVIAVQKVEKAPPKVRLFIILSF